MLLHFQAQVQCSLDMERISPLVRRINSTRLVTAIRTSKGVMSIECVSQGAVLQDKTAFHVRITHDARNSASVSTQISVLRRQLRLSGNGDLREAFDSIVKVLKVNVIVSFLALTFWRSSTGSNDSRSPRRKRRYNFLDNQA